MQAYLPVVLRLTPDPPAPRRPVPTQSAQVPSTPRVFHAPARIRLLSSQPSIVDDVPVADAAIGASVPLPAIAQIGFSPRIDVVPPVVRSVTVNTAPKRIVQSSGAQAAMLIHQVVPAYPYLAKLTRISGTVHLTGIIATNGTIQDLHAESGPPLLIRAALDAVRQWVYQPTSLNGEPVEVITSIDVTFTLTE